MGKDMDGIPLGSSQLVTKTKAGLYCGSLIVKLLGSYTFSGIQVLEKSGLNFGQLAGNHCTLVPQSTGLCKAIWSHENGQIL